MHPDTAHRGRLLYVALGFLGLDIPPAAMPAELRALHAWLDTWHGIGLIAQGLARQDRDLSLTRSVTREAVTGSSRHRGAARGGAHDAGGGSLS
jgi:hypothetical protein